MQTKRGFAWISRVAVCLCVCELWGAIRCVWCVCLVCARECSTIDKVTPFAKYKFYQDEAVFWRFKSLASALRSSLSPSSHPLGLYRCVFGKGVGGLGAVSAYLTGCALRVAGNMCSSVIECESVRTKNVRMSHVNRSIMFCVRAERVHQMWPPSETSMCSSAPSLQWQRKDK